MAIIIIPEIVDALFRHTAESYPRQYAGFLFGSDLDNRIVEHFLPIEVTDPNPSLQLEIDDYEYLKADKYARQHQLTLLGIFFSHPDHPAEPTPHETSKALRFFSYVILSLTKNAISNITSWRLNEAGEFEEESITGQQDNEERKAVNG